MFNKNDHLTPIILNSSPLEPSKQIMGNTKGLYRRRNDICWFAVQFAERMEQTYRQSSSWVPSSAWLFCSFSRLSLLLCPPSQRHLKKQIKRHTCAHSHFTQASVTMRLITSSIAPGLFNSQTQVSPPPQILASSCFAPLFSRWPQITSVFLSQSLWVWNSVWVGVTKKQCPWQLCHLHEGVAHHILPNSIMASLSLREEDVSNWYLSNHRASFKSEPGVTSPWHEIMLRYKYKPYSLY